jgi:hypothetical protein
VGRGDGGEAGGQGEGLDGLHVCVGVVVMEICLIVGGYRVIRAWPQLTKRSDEELCWVIKHSSI